MLGRKEKRIYLDYAAATPLSSRAKKAMARAAVAFGNPSSLHAEGREAGALLREARGRIARVLGAGEREIVLTGSGSEGNALAILGVMRAGHARGHLVTSAVEHRSTLSCAEAAQREGHEVTYLPVDGNGSVSPAALAAALRPDTTLVSIMYANNEIGTVLPIRALADVVRAARAKGTRTLFHTDACQAPGYLPVDAKALGVDLMTVNSSKVYGPKGIGALVVGSGIRLEPIILGEQWEGRRGGTESVSLALGFAEALEESLQLRDAESLRLTALRELFFAEIEVRIPGAFVNGDRRERLPNNVHVTIPGIEGESILLMLDAAGIAASTGSACNALDLAPSHVLRAIGQDPAVVHGSVRFSMGRETTTEDVRAASRELARVASLLRSISSLTVPTPSLHV